MIENASKLSQAQQPLSHTYSNNNLVEAKARNHFSSFQRKPQHQQLPHQLQQQQFPYTDKPSLKSKAYGINNDLNDSQSSLPVLRNLARSVG